MVAIDFWFDFGSPNAYLAHRAIPAMEARLEARVIYRPALLGGLFKLASNRSPVEAFSEIPNKLAYERLEFQRFIARHAISDFAFNPHFPINTLQMMRGAVAAGETGSMLAYVDAVFDGMWRRKLKMGDPDVLWQVIEEAGLPAAEIAVLSQDPEIKARLVEATQELFEKKAFGIPTFFVDDEIYFGKDRMRDVEDAFQHRRGDEVARGDEFVASGSDAEEGLAHS